MSKFYAQKNIYEIINNSKPDDFKDTSLYKKYTHPLLDNLKDCKNDTCKIINYNYLFTVYLNYRNILKCKQYSDSTLKYISIYLNYGTNVKKYELIKADVLIQIVPIYLETDYKVALNYINNAKIAFEKYNVLTGLYLVESKLAVLYANLNQYTNSLKSFYKQRTIALQLLKTDTQNKQYLRYVAAANHDIAVSHADNKNYVLAKKELINSAEIFYKLADTNLIIYYHVNLSEINTNLKNYKQAHEHIDTAVNLLKIKKDNKRLITLAYINKSSIYSNEGDYENSLINIKTAEMYAKQNNLKSLLKDIYDFRAILSEKMKQYKDATLYYKLASNLKDTIYKQEALKNEFEFKEKYESEKKEKEILKLSADNNIKQLEVADERKAKRLFFIIAIAISLILVLVLILFYTLNKLRKKEAKTNIELNKQAAQIAKYQSQMNPHFIFNALSNLQNLIAKNKGNEANNLLLHFTKLMRKTLTNSDLEYINLSQEIDYLTTYFDFEKSKFSYPIYFNITIDETIEQENLLILPMLIQPFIENSFKHGGFIDIKNPTITLTVKKQSTVFLNITIIDNGKGLQQSHQSKEHQSKAVEITKKRIVLWYQKYKRSLPNYFTLTNNFDQNTKQTGITVNLLVPLIEEF